MDPLAGFFVLFGLIFDVVGAILIISPIIFFKSNWNREMLEMKKDFFKEKMGALTQLSQIVIATDKAEANKQFLLENKEAIEKLRREAEKYQKQLTKDIDIQKKDYTERRARSGLACLVGGFAMQGGGVVIQLIF